jgi:hypothetical protein
MGSSFSAPLLVGGVPVLAGFGGGVIAHRKVYHVNGGGGSGRLGNDQYSGLSLNRAFATIQKALNTVVDGDAIMVMGDAGNSYDEQLSTGQNTTAANMEAGKGRYCQIIGVRPTLYPYASPQLYNVSGSTGTIIMNSPGWRLSGFRIVGDSGSPRCVQVFWAQAGNTNATNWAPGFQMDYCVLYGAVGSCSGLNIQGVPDVRILNNIFELFPTTALPALESVGVAVAPTNRSSFLGNQFLDNKENMDIALNASNVEGNKFGGNHVNAMVIGLNLANGNDNIVTDNYFAGDYTTDLGRYVAGSGDSWQGNHSMDTGAASSSVDGSGLTVKIPQAG